MNSFDFRKHSRFIPPADPESRREWLLDHEERIAKECRTVLGQAIRQASKEFIDSLTATGDLLVFDKIVNQFNEFVDQKLVPQLQGIFMGGALNAWVLAPEADTIPEDITEWPSVMNEAAADYALQATNRMKNTTDTIWNTIKVTTMVAIQTGQPIEKMKETLQKEMNYSEFKADTIARTEVLNAFNNGDWQGNVALGPNGPTHKQWISAMDDRVRPNHLALNGTVLPIDQPFNLGNEQAMYPHAAGMSAKNAVNCRCVLGYLYDDDPLVQKASQPVEEMPAVSTNKFFDEVAAVAKKQTEGEAQTAEQTSVLPKKKSMAKKVAELEKAKKAPPKQKKVTEPLAGESPTPKKGQPIKKKPSQAIPEPPAAPKISSAPSMKAPTTQSAKPKSPPLPDDPELTAQGFKGHPMSGPNVRDFSGKDRASFMDIDGEFDEWRKSLSQEESWALKTYTGSYYKTANGALRTRSVVETGRFSGNTVLQRVIDGATDALRRARLSEDTILMRGLGDRSGVVWDMPPGTVFHDPGFQSTSAGRAPFGSLKIRIFAPKGTQGAYLGRGSHSSFGHDELEVLLPPGGTYRVLSRETFNGTKYLDVELISQGNPPPKDLVKRAVVEEGMTRL